MKKALLSLGVLLTVPAFAADKTFGEYSIWCDNMRHKQQETPTDLVIFQPEGSDPEKVKSAYGSHSTNRDGNWDVEFELKVTSLEKDEKRPLLYMELTTTNKKGGNSKGDGVIKTGWVLFDQQWTGQGYLRTADGVLHRLECQTGRKLEPRE